MLDGWCFGCGPQDRANLQESIERDIYSHVINIINRFSFSLSFLLSFEWVRTLKFETSVGLAPDNQMPHFP